MKSEPQNSTPPSQVDFPHKPLPRAKSWLRNLARVLCLIGILAGVTMHSEWPFLVALIIVALLVITFEKNRCPQCKNPFNSRQVEEAPGYRRLYHDCANCKITWVSQDVSVDG